MKPTRSTFPTGALFRRSAIEIGPEEGGVLTVGGFAGVLFPDASEAAPVFFVDKAAFFVTIGGGGGPGGGGADINEIPRKIVRVNLLLSVQETAPLSVLQRSESS